MSSSNTTQQDSPLREEKLEHSNTEIKESQTSSLVPQREDSARLKSKERKEERLVMTKNTSSNKSKQMEESPLSRIQSMTLFQKLKLVVKMYYVKFIVSPIARFKLRPRKILVYTNSKLKHTCEVMDFYKDNPKKYSKVCRDLDRLVHIMVTTLNAQSWGMKLGIAAPQIGINKRVMIMRGKVYVNPEFTPTKAPTETVREGCYSLGKRQFDVQRAKYGWAKWLDIKGVEHEEKIKGLEAIVFQHELNHLDGKFCCSEGKEIKVI